MKAQASAIDPRARGKLRRKIERHPTPSISQPPTTGPIAPAMAPAAAQVPTARPLASPENDDPRMARLVGIKRAAPTLERSDPQVTTSSSAQTRRRRTQ